MCRCASSWSPELPEWIDLLLSLHVPRGACASFRCSSLFSVAVEWKLHPEEVEPEVCRSRLQLFRLAGGASRTDLRGSVLYSITVSYLLHGPEELEMICWCSAPCFSSNLTDWRCSWWIKEVPGIMLEEEMLVSLNLLTPFFPECPLKSIVKNNSHRRSPGVHTF